MKHIPVLLQETIKELEPQDGEIIVDLTLGSAGHSLAICQAAKNITLIGIDADIDAIERSRKRLKDVGCKVILENYYNDELIEVLENHNIKSVDKVLIDLGMSSDQLDDSGRGFSFQRNEPLDMRMSKKANLKASTILNTWDKENLEIIFEAYGDEKFSKRIADGIIKQREEKAFVTTSDLVDCIKSNVPKWYLNRKSHPATKVFQALRVVVNNEFERMKKAIDSSFKVLNPNGRISVITFNSLEDRYIKNLFKNWQKADLGKKLNKKGTAPSREEIKENPRARSARLRTFIKK